MLSTSCEMPSWIKHKIESRLPREISIASDMQMTPPLWQKAKQTNKQTNPTTKEPIDEDETRE